MMRRSLVTLAVVALAATACSPTSSTDTTNPAPGIIGSAFQTFDCDGLLSYYKQHGTEIVGPWGLGGQQFYVMAAEGVATDSAAASNEGGVATPETQTSRSFTESNNQVAGVDEMDTVKTDGNRIFTLLDGSLRIALVGDPGITMSGVLKFDWGAQGMVVQGDTVVVLGQVWSQSGPMPVDRGFAPQPSTPITRLAQVDVSDPANPKLVRTLDLDGSLVSARNVDGSLRVAITTNPVGLAWHYPEGGGLRSESVATEANKQVIAESTLDNWLPWSVLTEANGSVTEGRLLDCTTVMAPTEFSGLDTLSLLTFDMGRGLGEWADAGVVASGATMYATADTTYLATSRWMNWQTLGDADVASAADGFVTRIHEFDTSNPGAPRYVASGSVPGFLLNQFSMDEYDGDLRVASTTMPPDRWTSDSSDNRVTVLRQNGQELDRIGVVSGLGQGEQIFAVRFMGDLGYVVTFRQTDPLYVIDLSDPTAPKAVGQLKIPGYSAYLHPVGPGLILGLGQDATDEGRTTGTQMSLFDVSDPANPTRLDTVNLDGGYSQAENNHLAFTFTDGTALAPFERWDWTVAGDGKEQSTFDTGVLVVRVGADSLSLDGILRTSLDSAVTLSGDEDWSKIDPWSMVPQRTIVIDGYVYTVANGGIAVHDMASLDRITFVGF